MLAKLKKWLAAPATSSRQRLIGLAASAVLAAVGFSALGYGLASQQIAPTPSASAAGIITPTEPSKPTTPILGFSRPTSISIPVIKVYSQLISVGKNSNDTIATPVGKQRNYAAWYKYSPAPGQSGAAVIEGHLDTYSGASVFFDLAKLAPGDEIFVNRADKKQLVFTVQAVRSYLKSAFPTMLFYGADDASAQLHLITCGGSFSQASDSYDQNTIVYAKLTSVN